jgi:nicotinate-nucleotide pyrophosphorylase
MQEPIDLRRHEDSRLVQHIVDEERRLSMLENDIKSLSTEVASLKASVSDLVTAWKTANGVVAFVKWLAGIATAVIAIVALVKLGK